MTEQEAIDYRESGAWPPREDARAYGEFVEKVKERPVKFFYVKENGIMRTAYGTTNPSFIGSALPPKDESDGRSSSRRRVPSDSTFSYFDLQAKAFRSFRINNFVCMDGSFN